MEYKLKPWGHQLRTINTIEAYDIDFYALFHDMGCGKSKTVLEILRLKCQMLGRVPRVLILAPSAVQENWAREIEMHTYIDPKVIQIVDGCTKPCGKVLKTASKKRKIAQLQDQSKQIFIATTATPKELKKYKVDKKTKKKTKVNLEDEVWYWVTQAKIEFIIIDEAHNYKDNKGTRTKGVHKLVAQPQLKYRFILTGSPVLQNALDLWSQFYILSPMILGSNFYDFRSQYFYDEHANIPKDRGFYPSWIPKDEKYFNSLRGIGVPEKEIDRMTLNNLNTRIYMHADRVMKTDVLDLPPRTYQTLTVGMSKEHQKIYDTFKMTLVAILEEKPGSLRKELERILENDLDLAANIPDIMSADLAIVKTIRLMQLICGIFTNDEGEIKLIPTLRLQLLKETLETITANKLNKVVVWTIFTPTYEQIAELCADLKVGYVFLNGSQSMQEKQIAIDLFQKDPATRLMIANPAAGGTGVNLTSGNYEIDYSRGFKLGDWLQKDARVDRGGQVRNTTSITITTPDTIDERVVQRLKEKAKHAEDILAIKKGFSRSDILGMI